MQNNLFHGRNSQSIQPRTFTGAKVIHSAMDYNTCQVQVMDARRVSKKLYFSKRRGVVSRDTGTLVTALALFGINLSEDQRDGSNFGCTAPIVAFKRRVLSTNASVAARTNTLSALHILTSGDANFNISTHPPPQQCYARYFGLI